MLLLVLLPMLLWGKQLAFLRNIDERHHAGHRSDFHPRAISIIGSSGRAGSFGRLFLEGMIRMGYPAIYPVHPREKELLGLRLIAGLKKFRSTSTWQYHWYLWQKCCK